MKASTPIVAIIGRPNVGKSTLFNALVKSQKAIVSDISGTTRDSLMEKVIFQDKIAFWLVDTAGLTNEKGENLEQEIQAQVKIAMENADVILFLIDGKKELTADDFYVVEKLRKSNLAVIIAANKVDDGSELQVLEFSKLGLGTPLAVSAKNYTNIRELHDVLDQKLQELGFVAEEKVSDDNKEIINIALVGRPNVGKSSLLNAFLGHSRSVVSDIPGTTRDTIDTEFTDANGQEFCFLDTAGLRKSGKIGRNLEFWASVRTTRAIERADVCVLLIDALDGVTHQDLAIAGKIVKQGKGIIVGVNKFDLVRNQSRQKEESDDCEVAEVKMWGEGIDEIRKKYLSYLHRKISFLPWAPVLFFSAKTRKGISEIPPLAREIFEERKKRISTSELNRWIPEIFYGNVAPSVGTKQGKIKYVSQVDSCPPKFVFFVNNIKAFHFSYRRYLENKIREKYGFFGIPIIIELRDAMEKRKS